MLGDRGGPRKQRQAYRRGFLIGVTLAEVGILLVFVLLLCASVLAAKEKSARDELERVTGERKEREIRGVSEVASAELIRLRERSERLEAVETLLGGEEVVRDNFDVLVNVKEFLVSEEALSLVEALRKAEAAKEATRRRLEEELKRGGVAGAAEIGRRLDAQAFENEALRARQAELMERLAREGKGLDYPSCIPRRNGRTSFLYRIVLGAEGIGVEEVPEGVAFAKGVGLPLPDVSQRAWHEPQEFIDQTKPLFDWSEAQRCRFVVHVTDQTGVQDKLLYKRLLAAVEVNFYKSLATGPL